MAKQIEGVYEQILECAKKEFLEKGYTDASLRIIAAEAETSTNSIYVRFKDKEGLFALLWSQSRRSSCHIMTTSYFEGVFEVVRHKMGREDAKKYVAMMGKHHHAGFLAIAGNE